MARARTLAIAFCLALTWGTAGTRAAEPVKFPGEGITLEALLFRPAGSGPFPAVIALHGCGGLYGKDGQLNPRHADWGERLSAQGFLVLMPDSFGPRGATSQCRTEDRVARAWRERVDDVFAARAYLLTRPDIKADAISLLGWSNGGTTVLYALRDDARALANTKPAFAKAVAFYPGCRVPAEKGNWHTRVPLLILMGAADDWTPPAPCEALAKTASGHAEPVKFHGYPGAYHDFDHPGLAVHERKGLAYTGDGSGRAHIGTDPAAREDALKRVPEFLAQ